MPTYIASIMYHTGQIGAVIASYSLCSKLIDQRYHSNSVSLFRYSVHFFHSFE
jgi:hypothetical protein